ncbi:MAG: glycosyltransferase family 4 protein [Helicobacteraceae bacterium]|jgi:glycosyltransferase involved in cell wall biosynthesis|nr:glycosyltransferase family 4 protein [Helicobacteraceae bacterium]
MNILYISCKKSWGGVASWMVKTAEALEQRGHKVFILSARHSFFTQNAPKSLRLIPWNFGVDYSLVTIFYIIYLIKKHRVNIVVTNIEKEIACGGIAAKICDVPNIRRVGRHDDFNDAKPKIRFRHERFVTTSVAPCGAVWREALSHSPWLSDYPFTTIYNGRDPVRSDSKSVAALRESWGIDKTTIAIGTTSRLNGEKRIDLIIGAYVAALPKIRAPSALVICGSGKMETSLKAFCASLGAANHIYFVGFTTNPQLAASAYDIALSAADNEGFPNSVVEYMAQGCATIAVDTGGVKEIVIDRENGLLIDKGDEKALTDKIIMLANDAALRKKLGKAAQKRVMESFSEATMIDRFEAFYQEAATASRSKKSPQKRD